MEEKSLPDLEDARKIEKKLKLSSDLFDFALRIKMEQIAKKNPLMSKDEVRKEALLLIEKANT